MARGSWVAPTDAAEVWARAGGRRRYNRLRQDVATFRRIEILRMARGNENGWLLARGFQAEAAREFGMSPSTICRDVKAILEWFYERDTCLHCGVRRLPRGYQTSLRSDDI
jgi:hypothetical protein